MTASEAADALTAGFLRGDDYSVRRQVDEAGCVAMLVLVRRNGTATRLFGLRFVDLPRSPPTLRFWNIARWDDEAFEFDFTASGDAGSAPSSSKLGVPTMCIPYHVDYYKDGWHGDRPWTDVDVEDELADLMGNILRRA
jgi:hypothetical protein